MKQVKCSGPGCENRRRHHESDEPRGPQIVDVPDDWQGKRAFCSIECAAYGGTGVLRPPDELAKGETTIVKLPGDMIDE